MKTLTALLFGIVLLAAPAGAQRQTDQCLACHQQIEDEASKGFLKDIHYAKGLTCASCHGGDPTTDDMEAGMSPAKGFKGRPAGDAISAICASCHADAERMAGFGSQLPTEQAKSLKASVHGIPSVTGEGSAVQCTSCHGVHGILPPRDRRSPVHPLNVVQTCASCHSNASFMRRYSPSIPTDQLTEYRTSVHGQKHARGDANVATCVSCHGNHEVRTAADVKSKVFPVNLPGTCATCHSNAAMMAPYAIGAKQYEEYAGSVHGLALLEKRDLGAPACNDCHGNHGAMPPGVESISNTCGTCHALNAQLYAQSPHRAAFAKLKKPECESCHGAHHIVAATNRLIGTNPEAVCSQCHTPEKLTKGFVVAGHMRSLIDSLESVEQEAMGLVADAEQKGMEISEAKFKLRDVRQARLQSRTMIHSFNSEKFDELIAGGLGTASIVREQAVAKIDEYDFRRQGFGVATFIITLLAVSLYITIRRIERRQAEKAETGGS